MASERFAHAWGGEIHGDRVIIHNFRNCYYRHAVEFTCEWLTKTVFLSQLRGLDLFVDYWGSSWIAHPIVSFQFGNNDEDADYVAASIEARYKVGQSYSPIRSFFCEYLSLFTCWRMNAISHPPLHQLSIGRGCIPLPTWSQPGMVTPALPPVPATGQSPARPPPLVQRCHRQLHDQRLRANRQRQAIFQREVRAMLGGTLLNGRAPEMLYRSGNFAGNLPFPELKRQARINPVANTLDDAPDFSRRIRLNRPGFDFLGSDEDEGTSEPPPN